MLNLLYGLQHGRRKLSLIGNAAAAMLIFFLLYTATKNENAQSYTKSVIQKFYGDGDGPGESSSSPSSKYDIYTLENIDLSHLNKHALSDNFFYTRRIVNSKFVSGERKSLTDVNQALFHQSANVPYKQMENFQRRQDLPLELDVSVPLPAHGANTLSFGIATPIARLMDSLPHMMHWLPNTGAQLHVIAPADPRTKNVTEHIRALGINITIIESNDRFPVNYFSLLPLLYHTRLPSTKWLCLIDDDTFFPDLGALLAHLEERYNPKLPQVISAVSDDIVQIRKHGLMPFGGGGIFASVPFAAIICDNNFPGTAGASLGGRFPTPPNPNYSPFGVPMDGESGVNYVLDPTSPYRHSIAYKACLATDKIEGDQIFSDCINKQTKVRPQYDIEFHQMDMKGDLSGFFESGRRSLTIHHWKTWFHVDVPQVAAVTKICGKDCFLQRFRFPSLDPKRESDETWVLNNGYSITKYPKGIKGLARDAPPEPIQDLPRPAELPNPGKEMITANPRFLRQTGVWAQWPDLGLGEELVYEGEMGVIVDKSMAAGGPYDKHLDAYKTYGNLVWVPMSSPFAKMGKVDVPIIDGNGEELRDAKDVELAAGIEPKDAEDKDTESSKDTKSSEDESKDSKDTDSKDTDASKDESLKKLAAEASKDTSRKTTSKNAKQSAKDAKLPDTAVNAKEEISHFSRFRRSLSDIPRKLTNRQAASPVADTQPDHNATKDTSHLSPEELAHLVQTQEAELEDSRRFWSSVELTWHGQPDRFEHAIGPLRRRLAEDNEVVRYLMYESVGGWGDPGKQDTEYILGTVAPSALVSGWEGSPEKKWEEVEYNRGWINGGDAGYLGLYGPDPPPPADRGPEWAGVTMKMKRDENFDIQNPDEPFTGGGTVFAARDYVPPEENLAKRDENFDIQDPVEPFTGGGTHFAARDVTPVDDVLAKKDDVSPADDLMAKRDNGPVGGGSVLAARQPVDSEEDDGLAKRSWWSAPSTVSYDPQSGLKEGGMGGINRPSVDWVRQTYIKKRFGADEVIELIWMR